MSLDNTQISIKVLVPTTSNKESEFYCYACHRLFRIEKDLKDHDCIDAERYPYQCEKCGKYFQKQDRLKYHALTHDAPKKHLCKEEGCGKGFTRLVYLKQHCLTHAKVKPFSCMVCGRSFKLPHFLKKHSKVHLRDAAFAPEKSDADVGGYPYQCEMCGKIFQRKNRLEFHELTHYAPKKHICKEEGCGKGFTRLVYLKQHRLTHAKSKPFRCKVCGKSFKLPHFLKSHSYIHQTDATFIPVSELKTSSNKDFKAKIRANKDYEVNTRTNKDSEVNTRANEDSEVNTRANEDSEDKTRANKDFEAKIRANDDSKDKTQADVDSDREEEEPQEKLVRVFFCDICGTHFKNSYNLKKHCLKHSRTYQCVACKPELHFDSVASRQDHYDTAHSGKPFHCDWCCRNFATPPSFKKHRDSKKCSVIAYLKKTQTCSVSN